MKDTYKQFQEICQIYNDNVNCINSKKSLINFIKNKLSAYDLQYLGSGSTRACYKFNQKYCIKFLLNIPDKDNEDFYQMANCREINFLNSVETYKECFYLLYDYDKINSKLILGECGTPLNPENIKSILNITATEFIKFLSNDKINDCKIRSFDFYKFCMNVKYSKSKKYSVLRKFHNLVYIKMKETYDIQDHQILKNWIVVNRDGEDIIVMCDCGLCFPLQ